VGKYIQIIFSDILLNVLERISSNISGNPLIPVCINPCRIALTASSCLNPLGH